MNYDTVYRVYRLGIFRVALAGVAVLRRRPFVPTSSGARSSSCSSEISTMGTEWHLGGSANGRVVAPAAQSEPEPEVELAAQLADMALGETVAASIDTSAAWRGSSVPTRRMACSLHDPPQPPQPLALDNGVSAGAPRILDIADCDDEPARPSSMRLAARTGRKGSILDIIAQLSPTFTINTKASRNAQAPRTPLEGFVLDTEIRPEPQRPLKDAEVWDQVTRTWKALPTLGSCSKASSGRSRRCYRAGCRGAKKGNRGAKVDGACGNGTNSQLPLWVSTNRTSIRRGSKRASRRASERGRSSQLCVW